MIEHELSIWRAALDAAAKEADGFLYSEGLERDVAARIRGLIPTLTATPDYPLDAQAKAEYEREEKSRESLVARDVNASNRLSDLESFVVVPRHDLEQVRTSFQRGYYHAAFHHLSRILDGVEKKQTVVKKRKG